MTTVTDGSYRSRILGLLGERNPLESMEASAGIQQRIARSMFQKIDERIAKMAEAGKEPAKKP